MQILHNELMVKHTTFRIGGLVEKLYLPENEQELICLVKDLSSKGVHYRILGNGSNVLVDSKGLKCVIVKMANACKALTADGNSVYAGASVTLQEFVRFCVENSLHGNEFLFSIPATIGGAVYMNAGRGRQYGTSISDYVSFIRVFDGNTVIDIPKEKCNFSYRKSIFHKNKNYLILGALFILPEQKKELGEKNIKNRLAYAKTHQDQDLPNAGSIFSRGNGLVFNLLKGLNRGGAQFSKKTFNWINNVNSAKSSDVLFLIKIAKLLHFIILKRADMEIEYWQG
jgi:UDP-N-acetylmuramate dehydrogenase